MIVVYIIIFIILLSLLIVVHELGHFAMAKAFNVYCFDFSIGFGPAIIHRKRTNGETYFSVRIIPLGGFVSMYNGGDDDDDDVDEQVEELQIDPERSVDAKKKGKQAIIYVAGIVMNLLLALVIFFIYEVFFPQMALYTNVIGEVEENSIAETAGINEDDAILLLGPISAEDGDYSYYVMDGNALLTYEDGTTRDGLSIGLYLSNNGIQIDEIGFDQYLGVYSIIEIYEDGELVDYDLVNILEEDNLSTLTFNMYVRNEDSVIYEEDEYPENYELLDDYTAHEITLGFEYDEENDIYLFGDRLGVSMSLTKYRQGFGVAIKETFIDFGESSTAVVKAIGNLFRGKGWSSLGGIISIYNTTTTYLVNYGVGFFIYTWGLISVNLALLNIIPIPGLDGWQLLVCAIEAISRRKVPKKFKTVMSIIGYVIIGGLFVAILVMDILRLV
ncbi:MAG: site-2 protease family protein [Coprobacillus sp.]|nr:site-2 protease family protein [Coprobacillus sp.]